LDGLALTEWDRITDELASKQVITHVDMAILALYCSVYAEWCSNIEQLKNEDHFLITPKGYRYVNPRIGLINTYGEKLAKYSAELGITPSSRTRIKAIEKPPVQEDPKKTRIKALFGAGVTVK
jgi:P27 family predicted phage terminase small subunit